MVGFWTEYWNSNKDILLDGRFVPVNPAANYPLIMAIGEDKTIAAAYNDVVVPVHSELQELDIINAKSSGWIALDVGVELGHVTITSVDCTGNPVQERSARLGRGMHKLAVPPSGLISIRKR